MGESAAQFESRGLKVAVVTYDSVEVLRHFAERKQIRYPLLSDAGSKVIRSFGILNEGVEPGSLAHGVPHPVTYVLDAKAKVEARYFEADYRERMTGAAILVRHFNAGAQGRTREIETKHLKLAAWSSNDKVAPGARISLVIEVDLPERMHVYSPEVTGGYIPIHWKLDENPAWVAHTVTYPASRKLHLKAINETVPVYEKRFRLVRDITVGQRKLLGSVLKEGNLAVSGTFRYQACDDKVCFPPQNVPVSWDFPVESSDSHRVPAELRKDPGGRK